ncbi:MAG TPA: hypothetical protein VJ938_13860 [Acidimicrobiia bacterium]|nr:hypothetical protein [Acidimicrobiia bacterium]
MRSRSRRVGARKIGLSLLLVALVALPAWAAERTSSDVVLVDEGDVVGDDLYAAGNRVVILGRVDGDLIATAFEDVLVAGTVRGDVLAAAGSVVVTGTVGESVRAISPTIRIDGEVGGDVVSLGWSTRVAGDVTGDAVLWGWDVELGGSLGNDLEGQSRRLHLAGELGGDVDVTTRRLTVADGTVVAGDLGYRSAQATAEVDNAEVGGTVVHRLPLAANVRVRALMVMAKIVLSLVAAVVGLLVMWALPAASRRAVATVARSWWRAWLRGLAVLLAPAVVIGLGAFVLRFAPAEAALPVVGVAIPILLAVIGVVFALAFAAPAAVYPWLGRWGGPERSPVRSFLFATLAVTVVVLVPWLVVVVVLGVLPIGIGGWVGDAPQA